MDNILWETIIEKKKAKILEKQYFYAGFFWAIILLVGLLITFFFIKSENRYPNLSLYLVLIILFLLFLPVHYRRISITKFVIFLIILSFILGILSGATSWEEKLPRVYIPLNYGLPLLVFFFFLTFFLLDKKLRIPLPLEKVYIKENSIAVGNRSVTTSNGIITIQVAGEVWPKKNDFFIAKITANWTYMLIPLLAGGTIPRGIGAGITLGAYRVQQKKKQFHLTLPFDRQQLIQFLKAVSRLNVPIEIKDFCGNSCFWLTENIQISQKDMKQSDDLNKKIILQIFKRLPIYL